jgi:protocatechuate 3,4-dioxygenase beta subunit
MKMIVPHPARPLGRLLTRREALTLIGMTGATLLARELPALAATAATDGALPSCVARPAQTEGPFFVEEELNRSDIRSDPRSGEVVAGVPLRLAFRVSRISGASCAPLAGAQVAVWQCDATGRYSDVAGRNFSTGGPQFLRGYQLTDAAGAAQFLTIYPGWYGGRTVHVHFKIRTRTTSARNFEFTSQLYFDDALSDRIQAVAPYSRSGRRSMRNADDFLFRDGGRQLLLDPVQDAQGYAATFDIGLQI